MKHIYIKSTIIENPQSDCIYHLSHHNGEVIIRFTGTRTTRYFDLSTTLVKRTISPLVWFYYRKDDIIFFPRDILPYSPERSTLPPVLAWTRQRGFFTVDEYSQNLDTKVAQFRGTHTNIPQRINNQLEERYKNTFTMPVICGSFPIFHEDKRPTYKFIASLYALFMRFNDKSKLQFQNENSVDRCFMRAHFISQFLQTYFNITNIKIFKYWNQSDWATNAIGTFHTATAIMDDKSRLWVWDPWIGYNTKLLTMQQWLYRKEEPTPAIAMLASMHIILDTRHGRQPDGLMFRDVLDADNETAFQAVSGSVLINAPERPIVSARQMMSGAGMHGLFALKPPVEQRIAIGVKSFDQTI